MFWKIAACSLPFFWLFTLPTAPLRAQDKDPLTLVKQVADKMIRDTRFQLQPVLQKTELGMQVIDFSSLAIHEKEVAYAYTYLFVPADTTITLGINSTGALQLWCNRQHQFSQEPRGAGQPVEYSYGRFQFNNNCTLTLKKGFNDLLLRYEASEVAPVVYCRPVQATGDLQSTVQFLSPTAVRQFLATVPVIKEPIDRRPGHPDTTFFAQLPVADNSLSPWWVLGPFPEGAIAVVPGREFQRHFESMGKQLVWQSPPQKTLSELVIDPASTYRRDAYADWHYANGITLWSLQALSAATQDSSYSKHVQNWLTFLLKHKDYFEWQYQSQYAFRGSYHRLFRLSMLDDAGAPALAAAEQYSQQQTPQLADLLTPITDYIINRQMRLKDGTFCRPEPVDSTVWADDLFMSVPYLLRMAKANAQPKYANEAAKQFLLFYKHLHDPRTGLYQHGWYQQTRQQAVARWGRANGWMAWATAELLTWLPPKHPSYKKILKAFQEHAASLVSYQQPDGFWKQLPERSDAYEETSCTAMFSLVLARGVRKGWLPASCREAALNGWKAVASTIQADGTVKGICRGTEIGANEQYYLDRPTVDHDPRGLGAVITAGIEISLLNQQP
ncbi:MAG: glycoside hydrolase family 88 protein [Candidatus Pseudobacter hemicellulosilyticus]|uniref:Glycoside hydrolase family 88 protein n=1 Tax=Candidatus Pseudobacter hemicellulosilyticus TaxID=3121375 RepID=A0AAJ5WQF9_9BACT|nr:MAG: glycoside hydrolase family 88 protein [Pseudobacter sp.]